MKIKSTRKEILIDYIIPLILEFAVIGVLIVLFTVCVGKGPLLQEEKLIGDEMASPTLGRLIYGFVSFAGFIALVVMASRASKSGQDTKAFWLGYIAGILLWQSVGEISWHYSVGGINFTVLENITSFPIAVLACMLFVYCRRNHSFDWGVLITYISFMCNWIGHYITIGIYPFFTWLTDKTTWIMAMSFSVGSIAFVLSLIYLLLRVKTKKGRMLASLISFIALAIIAFGVLEG